jgi:hypothetical protein
MQTATVKYHVATYSGTVQVLCNEDDDDFILISRAIAVLVRQTGPLPFGYRYFEVTDREDN